MISSSSAGRAHAGGAVVVGIGAWTRPRERKPGGNSSISAERRFPARWGREGSESERGNGASRLALGILCGLLNLFQPTNHILGTLNFAKPVILLYGLI
jgi:hypothetical protein